jgi:hypothetical protein
LSVDFRTGNGVVRPAGARTRDEEKISGTLDVWKLSARLGLPGDYFTFHWAHD